MDYRKKYLKYKNKYLELQSQSGGANPYQPSGQYWTDALKEIIKYNIRNTPYNDAIYNGLREHIQRYFKNQLVNNKIPIGNNDYMEIDHYLVNYRSQFGLDNEIQQRYNGFLSIDPRRPLFGQ